ncbi:MAG: coenzyme F420-0:L-glutamate ligase [Planctomycetes bacterium]|nr:coenzyme F420-0:L-glutamate ligase [Planctomycetota bacterium]
MTASLQLIAVPGIPLVQPGDDLTGLIIAGIATAGLVLQDHDVVVIAQKVVSKAEGRFVDLATIEPSQRAETLAREVNKDPRLVEVILADARRIVRSGRDVLIVEHRLGFVMANAGVDQSNVAGPHDRQLALMLPRDPDASAARLQEGLQRRFGCRIGVVINDSLGRPWRLGTVGVAIGCAGLPALLDLRGQPDLFGRKLQVTVIGYADEIAAAASLLMGQADEARPVVIVRGLPRQDRCLPARSLIRPAGEDLFR